MFLCGIFFLSVNVVWPLYVVYWGYDFPKPLVKVLFFELLFCLVSATVLIAGLLLARFVARRFYSAVKIPPGKDTGWLGLILLAAAGSCPVTLYFADTELHYLAVIAFLVATVSGLIVLVGRKPFQWQRYVFVALGVGVTCGAVFSQTGFNMYAVIQMAARESMFSSEIDQAATLFDHDDLNRAAVQGSPFLVPLSNARGSLLVLNAEAEGEKGPYRLRVSHMETYLPPGSLAPNADSLGVVVIIGPPGMVPFGVYGPLRLPSKFALGAPVLVYKWPEREILFSGKIGFPGQCNDPDVLQRDGAKEVARILGL
jgi:hypothetical protein